jgi:hypothetical protein
MIYSNFTEEAKAKKLRIAEEAKAKREAEIEARRVAQGEFKGYLFSSALRSDPISCPLLITVTRFLSVISEEAKAEKLRIAEKAKREAEIEARRVAQGATNTFVRSA